MDREMVRLLALSAVMSYADEPHIEGFETRKVVRGSTEVYIFKGAEDLIIAFRGTDSAADARLDLRFWRKGVKGTKGTWHRGFVRALAEVYWPLLSALAFQGYQRRVWLTGHSLGGALAVLFAARCAASGQAGMIDGIVTLGAPRVGSVLAARWLNKLVGDRTLQFENAGDEIPHVPLAILGYHHVGDRHVFGKRRYTRWWRLVTKGLRTSVAHRGPRYYINVRDWSKE